MNEESTPPELQEASLREEIESLLVGNKALSTTVQAAKKLGTDLTTKTLSNTLESEK